MKKIVLAIIISGVVIISAFAQDYGSGSIPSKIAAYHVKANEITNDQIKALFQYFEDKDNSASLANEETRQKMTPPEDTNNCEDNFSAICLNHKLSVESAKLFASLLTQSGQINYPNKFVDEQEAQVLELQTQTVNFYRQLLLAYPLHKQYEITLKDLDKFIDNLKEFKKSFQSYPNKFHNATTARCT